MAKKRTKRDKEFKFKVAIEAIKGENLDIVVGSIPDKDDDKNKIKNAILKKLNEDYGIIEEDFISAELEAVPTFKARDIGFKRSGIQSKRLILEIASTEFIESIGIIIASIIIAKIATKLKIIWTRW